MLRANVSLKKENLFQLNDTAALLDLRDPDTRIITRDSQEGVFCGIFTLLECSISQVIYVCTVNSFILCFRPNIFILSVLFIVL